MKSIRSIVHLTLLVLMTGILSSTNHETNLMGNEMDGKMKIEKEFFGETNDGRKVDVYTLTNVNGITAKILDYGGIVYELLLPDKHGQFENVSANLETIPDYEADSPYFGALIGRYGNRIAKGKFTLDGKEYTLATNNDMNHLHGGIQGFDKVVWDVEEKVTPDSIGLILTYTSADMEEGYPGELDCKVVYELTNENELIIDYTATTDKPTPVNLTNHTYWNLGGYDSGTILDHHMQIFADHYLPVDQGLIPTGQLHPLKGTPMDFTEPTPIGERIDQVEGGYDHCYVLKNYQSDEMKRCAKVKDPQSGRVMEIFTTEPGVQFYTGNFLDGTLSAGDVTYRKHAAFCLETQHFPDSPNQPMFPSAILEPGDIYRHTTVHKFQTEN